MIRTIRWRPCAKALVRQAPQQIIVILSCKCSRSPVEGVINPVSFSWSGFSLFFYWDFVSYSVAPTNLIFFQSLLSLLASLSVSLSQNLLPLSNFLQLDPGMHTPYNLQACLLPSFKHCWLPPLKNPFQRLQNMALRPYYLSGIMFSKIGIGVSVGYRCLSASPQAHLSLLSQIRLAPLGNFSCLVWLARQTRLSSTTPRTFLISPHFLTLLL